MKYVFKSMDGKVTVQLPCVKQIDNRSGNCQHAPALVQFAMDAKSIRLLNLRSIIKDEFGGNAGKCADKLVIKRPQIHRWVTENENARQGISEDSARSIEEKLGKPSGSLDIAPDSIEVSQIEDAEDIKLIDALNLFVNTYRLISDEGRQYLASTIKVLPVTYPREERRTSSDVTALNDRRKQ